MKLSNKTIGKIAIAAAIVASAAYCGFVHTNKSYENYRVLDPPRKITGHIDSVVYDKNDGFTTVHIKDKKGNLYNVEYDGTLGRRYQRACKKGQLLVNIEAIVDDVAVSSDGSMPTFPVYKEALCE